MTVLDMMRELRDRLRGDSDPLARECAEVLHALLNMTTEDRVVYAAELERLRRGLERP